MGDDNGGTGGRVPLKNLLRGTQTQASIATFSKQKLDFFPFFDYYISILYIPILYHKTVISFNFHVESEEYAIGLTCIRRGSGASG